MSTAHLNTIQSQKSRGDGVCLRAWRARVKASSGVDDGNVTSRVDDMHGVDATDLLSRNGVAFFDELRHGNQAGLETWHKIQSWEREGDSRDNNTPFAHARSHHTASDTADVENGWCDSANEKRAFTCEVGACARIHYTPEIIVDRSDAGVEGERCRSPHHRRVGGRARSLWGKSCSCGAVGDPGIGCIGSCQLCL